MLVVSCPCREVAAEFPEHRRGRPRHRRPVRRTARSTTG